jgi:hypothetical protein
MKTTTTTAAGIPIETVIHRMVCVAIVLGVMLTHFVSRYFLFFLLFVAVNFFQSTFSWGICPPTIALIALGWVAVDPKEGPVPTQRVYFFRKGLPPVVKKLD